MKAKSNFMVVVLGILLVASFPLASHASTILDFTGQVTGINYQSNLLGVTTVGETFTWSVEYATISAEYYHSGFDLLVKEVICDKYNTNNKLTFVFPGLTITEKKDDFYNDGGYPTVIFRADNLQLLGVDFFANVTAPPIYSFETQTSGLPSLLFAFSEPGHLEGVTGTLNAVPIPGAAILLASGLIGLVTIKRKRYGM